MRLTDQMMVKRLFMVVMVVIPFFLSGCASDSETLVGAIEKSVGKKTVKEEGKAPVITASFAADKGMYGGPIKIYLAAEDPEGDMEKIAVQVTQVGYGFYPTSWSYLKPKYNKQFVGYLQWDTFSPGTDRMPEWTKIKINVTIYDKAGNRSKEVDFPYEFLTGTFPSPPLPLPFSQGKMYRIGWIDVDLINPLETPTGPR